MYGDGQEIKEVSVQLIIKKLVNAVFSWNDTNGVAHVTLRFFLFRMLFAILKLV